MRAGTCSRTRGVARTFRRGRGVWPKPPSARLRVVSPLITFPRIALSPDDNPPRLQTASGCPFLSAACKRTWLLISGVGRSLPSWLKVGHGGHYLPRGALPSWLEVKWPTESYSGAYIREGYSAYEVRESPLSVLIWPRRRSARSAAWMGCCAGTSSAGGDRGVRGEDPAAEA